MPFRDEAIDAICDLVDAAKSGSRRRIGRARAELRRAIDKPYFLALLESEEPMHRIPEEWRQEYLDNRPVPMLRKDVVVAFDKIQSLKTRIWVLTGALTCEGAIILWLANHLYSCLAVVQAASAASK